MKRCFPYRERAARTGHGLSIAAEWERFHVEPSHRRNDALIDSASTTPVLDDEYSWEKLSLPFFLDSLFHARTPAACWAASRTFRIVFRTCATSIWTMLTGTLSGRGVRVTAHHLEATPAIWCARREFDELQWNTVKCYCGPVALESSASFRCSHLLSFPSNERDDDLGTTPVVW